MYNIRINAKEKLTDVSDSLYGLFFEDINRAGDGGLYAELLRNRAFEDGVIPEGCRYDPTSRTITSPTGWTTSFDGCEDEEITGWEASGSAVMTLTSQGTLNPNRKRALCVKFNGGSIRNTGFNGISVEKGKSYRFYMFAKCTVPTDITVSLAGGEGTYSSYTFTAEGDYKKYECELVSCGEDHNAWLSLHSPSDSQVTLGFVSLFPKDTFMGRENGLRADLVQRLLSLRPAFLRFPGGCIVEGFSRETAYRFKDTIGPVWERRSHCLLWNYTTTNGLGFHEYLQFCEDAGIDAMYVCNCGMSCQGRCPDYFDDDLINELLEDAEQAILYALSPADTPWGAKRAANGHPLPFDRLRYIEIGNENWGEEYFKRYDKFYKRLKKRFGQLTFIATDHTEKAGLDTEYVDEHFYSNPLFFAANAGMYDSLPKGIKIYCGEYASTIGCKEGTLYGALGEAAFLTGVERNQDRVTMTSYAPLLKNVNHVSWEPDLIAFDNYRSFVIPSYHVLKMFAENRGEYVCRCDIVTESTRRTESGCFMTEDGRKTFGENFSSVENDKIHIRFWDKETAGEDQDHYDWIAENNKSSVIHYNGWSQEVICEAPCEIRERNRVEITTRADSFRITLNGITVHEHTLPPIPDLFGVSSVDSEKSEIILKIVNFSEKRITADLACDLPLKGTARVTVLTAAEKNAKNSFEEPDAVCPQTITVTLKDGTLSVPPVSVNVICMETEGQR